jgi:hypothetical protein
MKNEAFLHHIVKTVQSLCINTIEIDKGTSLGSNEIHIKRVKQGCQVSPTLFNIFIDEVIRQWQQILTKDLKIGNSSKYNPICR